MGGVAGSFPEYEASIIRHRRNYGCHSQKGMQDRRTGTICPALEEPVAPWRRLGAGDVVDVVAERDEQVEEQLAAAVEHLELHGAAALEGGAAADDEREVVGTQLGVGVGRVGVGVPRRREDGGAWDPGLCHSG